MTRPDDALYRLNRGLFTVLRLFFPVVVLPVLLLGPLYAGGPVWMGPALASLGTVVYWATRNLPLYPAHTFGIEYRVAEDTFDGPKKDCTECGTTVGQGLRRRYARQFVVMGVPIHTLEWGLNEYCFDCAHPGSAPVVDMESGSGRLRKNDDAARRELEHALE
jgi:hypothetical protein